MFYLSMEKKKQLTKKRGSLRTSLTNIINKTENDLKNIENIQLVEDSLALILEKEKELYKLDLEIENLIEDEKKYDNEIESAMAYKDKIILTKTKINRYLKNSQDTTEKSSNDIKITEETGKKDNHQMRLPTLEISKFYGDISQCISFWNAFKVAIHDNYSLSKVEKFNYLKSYLGGTAANAIEGFSISNANYDSAIDILNTRFGRHYIIINAHMEKLLNISPVQKSSEIFKLRKLFDNIEIQVRSLSSLNVHPDSYSNMLVPALLRVIPNDLVLEYSRKSDEE